MPQRLTTALVVLLSLLLTCCDREPQGEGPEYASTPRSQSATIYHLAIHPLHNPGKLNESYQPLIAHVNRQLAVEDAVLTLEASRDYASFEEKIRARRPEVLLPNPWQTLEAMKVGYLVIAMAGEPGDFKGIFVVRRDSGIVSPSDLKGKAVSYPSPTALAACIMPQSFLQSHGVKVLTDIENLYVGSQESSIMNVYLKQTAAGATWPPPWRAFQKEHPDEARALMVVWETQPLINNSVMVREDLPIPVRDRLRHCLLHLHESREGLAILAGMETARFLPAVNEDYEVARRFVERFEKDVRPVEQAK